MSSSQPPSQRSDSLIPGSAAPASGLDALPPEFAAFFPNGFDEADASPTTGPESALACDPAGTSALHDQLMALFASSARGDSSTLLPSDDPGAQTDEEVDDDMEEQSPLSAMVTPQDGLLVASERSDGQMLRHVQISAGAACVAVHAASVVLGRNPIAPTSALIDLGPVPTISRHHAVVDLQVRPPCIRVHGKHGLQLNGKSCQAGETVPLGYGSVTTVQIRNQCLELHIPSDAEAPGLQHPDPVHGLLDDNEHAAIPDTASSISSSAARNLVQAVAAVGAGPPTRKRKGSPGSDESEIGYGAAGSNDSDDGNLGEVETARQFLQAAAAAAATAASPSALSAPSPASGHGRGPNVDPVERRMSTLGLDAFGSHAPESDLFQIFPATSTSPTPKPTPMPLPVTAEESATTQVEPKPVQGVADLSPASPTHDHGQDGLVGIFPSPRPAAAAALSEIPVTSAKPEEGGQQCPPPPSLVPEPPSAKSPGDAEVPSPAVPKPPSVASEASATEATVSNPSTDNHPVPAPPSVPLCPSPPPAVPSPQLRAEPQARGEEERENLPVPSATAITDVTNSSPKTSPSISPTAKGKTTSKSPTAQPPPSNPAALAYFHAVHGASASSSTPAPASTGHYNPAALGYPPGFPPLGPLGMPGVLPGMLPGLYPGGASSFMSPFAPGYPGVSPFGMVPSMFPYPPPPATGTTSSRSQASPTPEKAAKSSPAARTSSATSKGASQSPKTPSMSANGASAPSIRIVVAPAPAEADPAASLPGPIESLLDGPPIVHHGGALYLHPDVFGTLSASEIQSLERAGIQEALQRLQSTLVVFLRARLKARKAQTPSTPGSPFRSRSSKRHARTGVDGSPAPSPAGSRAGSPTRRVVSRTTSPSRSALRVKPTTTPLARSPAVTSPLSSFGAPLPTSSAGAGTAPTANGHDTGGMGLGDALALDFGQYDNLAFPDPPSLDG